MILIEVSTIGIYAVYQNPLRCSFVHCATLFLYRYKNKLFYRRSTTIKKENKKIPLCRMNTKRQEEEEQEKERDSTEREIGLLSRAAELCFVLGESTP